MLNEYLYGNGDMHSVAAKGCFAKELEGIEIKDIKRLRPDLRKKAKAPNFSAQFGGSYQAIARSLLCSEEEAKEIEKGFYEIFKGLKSYKEKSSKEVKERGYILISAVTGHKQFWADHKEWLEEEHKHNREFWLEYRKLKEFNPKHSIVQKVKRHFKIGSNYERLAMNVPCQGTGILCTKESLRRLFNFIIENNYFNIIKIVGCVHDEILIEAPEKMGEEFGRFIEKTMEESASIFCKKLPIPAVCEVGKYWIH